MLIKENVWDNISRYSEIPNNSNGEAMSEKNKGDVKPPLLPFKNPEP